MPAAWHVGDFAGQCRYAYDKIKRLLATHGAMMNDVVKVVTYVTDVRNHGRECLPKWM